MTQTFQVGPIAPPGEAITPPLTPLHGQYTSVVPLGPEHTASLYKHLGGQENDWRWTYMLTGGHTSISELGVYLKTLQDELVCYAVLTGPASDPASEAAGLLSYLAVTPSHRRLEIGGVIFGEVLTRSVQASESHYLFIKHAVEDLGNLRVEWKANNLNKPSLSAAARLGFTYEGVFRNHMVVKGRRRDTAWFSITDGDWPAVKAGFTAWLDPTNFDEHGKQKRTLQECRESPQ